MNLSVETSTHSDSPLADWLTMLRKSAFINDYVVEQYSKRTTILGICTIISMFALAVISAVSVSLLGSSTLPSYSSSNSTIPNSSVISGDVAVWVTLAFNIASLVVTALLGAIHSIKELFGWDDFITELREYVKDAIALAGTVEIKLSLGVTPSEDFLASFSQKMIDFRNHAPNIGTTNFLNAEQRWNDYISNPRSVKMMMICDQHFPLRHITIDHDN
jgi:hypothetical protein